MNLVLPQRIWVEMTVTGEETLTYWWKKKELSEVV